jgi:WS/DGAT/MGAT family acyltransferase
MFLHLDTPSTPMNVVAVMTLDAASRPVDVPALSTRLAAHLRRDPRLRRRIRQLPGGVLAPWWADDYRFELGHHLRHVALPTPGSIEQLHQLVADVLAEPLDRSRPLWELHVVEGLAAGRAALIVKAHHAMGDGLGLMAMAAILFDPASAEPSWRPTTPPTTAHTALAAASWYAGASRKAAEQVRGLAGAVCAAWPESLGGSPAAWTTAGLRLLEGSSVPALHAITGPRRRFTTVGASLADHRAVRRAHGGTVNDVVLAAVAGALRRWLADRGEHPATVRALVPTSLRARNRDAREATLDAVAANAISAHLIDLPTGTADPLHRLTRVRTATSAAKRRGPAPVPLLAALAALADLMPASVQGAASRLVGRHSARLYDVLITNVPGPPRPLRCGDIRVRDLVPAVPLGPGQVLAIGVMSCDGTLTYGLTADHDAVPDLDRLAAALRASITELIDHSPPPLASLRPVSGPFSAEPADASRPTATAAP